MKTTRRFAISALSLCLILSLLVPCIAAADSNYEDLKYSVSPSSMDVTTFLDNSPTTQTITFSEQELIQQMLEEGTMTRLELDSKMQELSSKSRESLRLAGYNENQISIISVY